MNRDLLYLQHILESIEKIENATKNTTRKKFENSGIIRDGIFYNLQTMAESTQKISKSLKLDATEISWQEINGFRNHLAHNYLGINFGIVWNVIKKELPKLKKRVIKMIKFLQEKEKNS